MRLPRFTTRRLMVLVAVATVLLCGAIGIRRADHFARKAEYHRRIELELEAESVRWETLASDPSKESDLPSTLFQAGIWARDKALEVELESFRDPSGPRRKLLLSEAKAIAIQQLRACRRRSEYHGRQRSRLDLVSFSPWLPVPPDPPPPE